MSDAALLRLAEEEGIATSYLDWRDRRVAVPLDTLRAVLTSLGHDAGDPKEALAAHRNDIARRLLPPAVVTRLGRAPALSLPKGSHARIRLEDGAQAEPGPGLPLGVHELHVEHGARRSRAPLLVVPGRLSLPPSPRGRRSWGLMAQIYAVRSRSSWGMGDLRDLAELCDWSARDLGASFTLINPVHATEPTAPVEPSPYLPVGRRYHSPLYVRIEDVPEYTRIDPVQRDAIQRRARPLRVRSRTADLIDRDQVWEAKRAALEILHQTPRTPAREADFQAYLEREGAPLIEFATWCTLAEEYGTDYRRWPEHLRDVSAPAVGEEALNRWDRVEFHRWLQWILAEQLAAAQTGATAAGMPIGIISDLAVGVQGGGADAWMYAKELAPGITVGAPPDEFNQLGQDWAQPPWHPSRLARAGYGPLLGMLRQAMRHAGGVRVDHVMGLFRLWWIPEGAGPDQGTYVRYDHEGLVGALLLAAHQTGTVAVGEDLGTVEPWVREHLAGRGILGTSMLWFEREEQPLKDTRGTEEGEGTRRAGNGGAEARPLPPERWRADCLATVATHDLPPIASYVTGEHVELRGRLGLLARPVEAERADNTERMATWRGLLVELGLLDPGVDPAADPAAMAAALHGYLARTPAHLIGVALSDLVGERRMQNLPGTVDAYPNWRIPLTSGEGEPVLLDELISDPYRLAELRRALGPLAAAVPQGGRWLMD